MNFNKRLKMNDCSQRFFMFPGFQSGIHVQSIEMTQKNRQFYEEWYLVTRRRRQVIFCL